MRWKIKLYEPKHAEGIIFLWWPKKFDREWVWLEFVKWDCKDAQHDRTHQDCPHVLYFDSKGKLL